MGKRQFPFASALAFASCVLLISACDSSKGGEPGGSSPTSKPPASIQVRGPWTLSAYAYHIAVSLSGAPLLAPAAGEATGVVIPPDRERTLVSADFGESDLDTVEAIHIGNRTWTRTSGELWREGSGGAGVLADLDVSPVSIFRGGAEGFDVEVLQQIVNSSSGDEIQVRDRLAIRYSLDRQTFVAAFGNAVSAPLLESYPDDAAFMASIAFDRATGVPIQLLLEADDPSNDAALHLELQLSQLNDATLSVEAPRDVAPPTSRSVLASYPLDGSEGTLSEVPVYDPDRSHDGNGSLRIETDDPARIELFPVYGLDLDASVLAVEAELASQLSSGQAYLEMWVTVEGRGDFFARALDTAVEGESNWRSALAPFLLQPGQRATSVRLNLVVDGAGTVWIDDLHLYQEPLP